MKASVKNRIGAVVLAVIIFIAYGLIQTQWG
jgi:hypothetical protein